MDGPLDPLEFNWVDQHKAAENIKGLDEISMKSPTPISIKLMVFETLRIAEMLYYYALWKPISIAQKTVTLNSDLLL